MYNKKLKKKLIYQNHHTTIEFDDAKTHCTVRALKEH